MFENKFKILKHTHYILTMAYFQQPETVSISAQVIIFFSFSFLLA